MRNLIRLTPIALLLLATAAAHAQTPPATPPPPPKLAFDVATVKPSPPPDIAKLQADMQAGRMPRIGPHIEADRADYIFMSLKDLIAVAYKIKSYQVTGPDWLAAERFDIAATIPEGASRDDAPAMLQSLLAERFKLVAHRDTQEHPVLALVVAKGGVKLKESTVAALPIDENAPLKPGEMKVDMPDGPVRVTRNHDGSATVNMGAKGTFTQKMDGQTLRIEASTITMAGFAEMLTQMMLIGGGGGGGRQVVDMTGLKGSYQVAVELSMADLIAGARAAGMDVPGPGKPGGGGDAATPSDPSGGATVYESVQKLGLKLESRKAPVEQTHRRPRRKNPHRKLNTAVSCEQTSPIFAQLTTALGNQLNPACVLSSMGVLQMAMPTAGVFPTRPRASRPTPVRQGETRRQPLHPAASHSSTPSSSTQRDTLLPPANPSRSTGRQEALLHRTPEQEAAQAVLGHLVRQCMAGDQHAWQQLVTSQHRRIYAICYRFTGSAGDAEDLTQDVFLKLYRNLASYDLQKGSFQTWITTLARNLLVDHFRRTRLERATDSLDASLSDEEDGPTRAARLADSRPSPEHHVAGLELKVRIQQALAQLSPELREAVVLRDLEDMDYKDIAQVLRIPEGTVKSRISRGRGELARLLQRIEGQVV